MLRGLLTLAVCSTANAARPPIDQSQLRADVEAIASHPSRAIGSEGYRRALEYVKEQIAAMGPAVELREHRYDVIVPVTKRATLTLASRLEGETEAGDAVYPFWPAFVRVNSTPAGGITGDLVYLGEARLDQIQPGKVRGQIAVVESVAAWQQAAYFGAKAIIVLERRARAGASRSWDTWYA